MDQIIIFANGDISKTDISLPSNSTVLAADGGAHHCLKLGITPQVVIGDFDSLTDEDISTLESKSTILIKHPKEKDETDLELTLDYAARSGAKDITLYGLLGGRWDMTFANMLLLTASQYDGINFKIIDGNTTAYILRAGETLTLHGKPGNTISAIPLERIAHGITYKGLRWPLENASLPYGTPRGVSNVMEETKAQISLDEGILLVFMIDSVNL